MPRHWHEGLISEAPNTVILVSLNQILDHCIQPGIICSLISPPGLHELFKTRGKKKTPTEKLHTNECQKAVMCIYNV